MITVLLNVLAWNSTAFCDAYIFLVFPLWVNTYGRLTGIFPFSVGEWLLVAGAMLVILAVLMIPVFLLFRKTRHRLFGFYRFLAWVVLIICMIMTLNCSILYHVTPFSEKYIAEGSGEETEKVELLFLIRNMVVEKCNVLSKQVERNAEGVPVYSEDSEKMGQKARIAMKQLGRVYAQLDGWYPTPKPLLASDFVSQQYMAGYYFPFSMEANYNDVMNDLQKPATMCHELAHLRGYILEDEANFIGYLACVQSEDAFFEYSGYLSVLNYLNNDLLTLARKNPTIYAKVLRKHALSKLDPIVREDNIFVSDAEWDRINQKAWFDTGAVDAAADVYLDVTLKANGVPDGKISYCRVVEHLLDYYATRRDEL